MLRRRKATTAPELTPAQLQAAREFAREALGGHLAVEQGWAQAIATAGEEASDGR